MLKSNKVKIHKYKAVQIILALLVSGVFAFTGIRLLGNSDAATVSAMKSPDHHCYKWGVTRIRGSNQKELEIQEKLGVHWFANWSIWTSLPEYGDNYIFNNTDTMRQNYVKYKPSLNSQAEPTDDLVSRIREARERTPHDTLMFSIGNEPDEPTQADISPQDFADAYYKYHKVISSIDSNIDISAAGITSGQKGIDWYESFRNAWAANSAYRQYSQSINGTDYPPVAYLDIHLYGSTANPDDTQRPANRNAHKYLKTIYSFMDARPELQNKKIIVTETGLLDWWTWGDQEQAVAGYDPSPEQYMVDLIDLINNDNRIHKAFWFSSDNPKSNPWFEAALFDQSGNLNNYGQIFRDNAGGCFGEFNTCSLSATHPDCRSTVTIKAKGGRGQEDISLEINSTTVKTWENIGKEFADYQYEIPPNTTVNDVRVNFVDTSTKAGKNKVWIDYIDVNGKVYQSEASDVEGKGIKSRGNKCHDAILKPQTELLSCGGGWFDYNIESVQL